MGLRGSTVLGVVLAAAFYAPLARAAAPDAGPVEATLQEGLDGHTAAGRRSATDCRRWRSLAARLGETYAGYRLRHTVVPRMCAFAPEDGEEETWSWPWRHHDVRADLPPQRHAAFGAWEIRCGQAGPRRRCALALETVTAAPYDAEADAARVVSHVVIDTVAGRESVLWRVHVEGSAGASGITVSLAGSEAREPFDACGRRGCMAEAEPRLSAEVATWLWSGRPIAISIGELGAGARLSAVLSADGFRRGLGELIRLRGREGRALAGR